MNLKQLITNKQSLSFAGNMLMALLNIVTQGILLRHLGTDEVGIWFLFLATFNFIDTFRTGVLQTAFIKFFSGAEEQRADSILGSTWYIGLLTTAALCLITWPGCLFVKYIADTSIVVIMEWTGVLFISTLPIVMATWLLQARQRYMEILLIRGINQGSFILAIIGLIFFNKLSLYSVLLANVLSCVLTSVIVLGCRWTGIAKLTKRTRIATADIYHFGKFSMGTSISSNLLRNSDTYIINFTLGHAAVAVYNIAQSLMNIIEIPLRSFVTTAMTSLSEAQNSGSLAKVKDIMKKYAGTLTVLFIPVVIGALIFADFGVGLLGGGKWVHTQAANVFRIFMIFAIFFPIDRFTGVTLDVIHQPKINFYKVLAMLAINVAGDFAGIYLLHNVYGVAIASIPTFVIGTLIGYLSLKKFLKFNFSEILKTGYAEAIVMVKGMLGKFAGKPSVQ